MGRRSAAQIARQKSSQSGIAHAASVRRIRKHLELKAAGQASTYHADATLDGHALSHAMKELKEIEPDLDYIHDILSVVESLPQDKARETLHAARSRLGALVSQIDRIFALPPVLTETDTATVPATTADDATPNEPVAAAQQPAQTGS